MFRVAVFPILFSLIVAQPAEQRTPQLDNVGDANQLIDELLREANKLMPAKEPLPDIGTELNLKNCFVFGLDSGLSRVGNSSMTFSNGSVVLGTALTITQIGASCDWSFSFLDGSLTASTSVVTMHAVIASSLKAGSHPDLKSFNLQKLGDFSIKMTGVSILDKVVTEIAELVVNGPLKDTIEDTINTKLPPIIEEALKKIHI